MVLCKDQQSQQTARMTKGKKKTQITKVNNERGNISTNLTEIKSTIKEYYEQQKQR